jgi:hypothetical protein
VPRDGTFEGELAECIERCRAAGRTDLIAELMMGLYEILKHPAPLVADPAYIEVMSRPIGKRDPA